MKAVATLALLAISLPLTLFAKGAGKTSTFASPDGAFRFEYPSDFQLCTNGNREPCNYTFMPVCDKDAPVCVVYPSDEFKGASFGAGFQVRELLEYGRPPETADACVNHKPFYVSAEHPVEQIDGVSFLHGIKAGAAMGHWDSVDYYRAFHKGKCFELSISSTGMNPDITDSQPVKTLTPAEDKRVSQTMSVILHSFRFTN
jgi:hypothetical protein